MFLLQGVNMATELGGVIVTCVTELAAFVMTMLSGAAKLVLPSTEVNQFNMWLQKDHYGYRKH